MCRDACEGYPPDYSGTASEADELLRRICMKVYYWLGLHTEGQGFFLNTYDGLLHDLLNDTLCDLMKNAQTEDFDYRAIARKHINKVLGRTDE